jgi:hypothetical protein
MQEFLLYSRFVETAYPGTLFAFFLFCLHVKKSNFENFNNEEQPECIPCIFSYSLKHVLLDSVEVADIRQTFYIII